MSDQNIPLFGNFGKSFKDLYKKKYDFENIVKLTSKVPCGWTLTTTGKVHKDTLQGVLKAVCVSSRFGEAELEADTATGKSWFKATFSKFVPNTKFILNGGVDPTSSDRLVQIGPSLKAEAEHVSKTFSASGSVLLGERHGQVTADVEVTGAFGHEGGSVGLQVKAPLEHPAEYAVNLGAQYDYKDFCLSLLTDKHTDLVKVSWWHKASRCHSLGVEYVSDESKGARPRVLNFASEYQYDPETLLKFRANNYGEIGAVVEHQVGGPSLTISAAAQFIAKGLSLRSDKFGLTISF